MDNIIQWIIKYKKLNPDALKQELQEALLKNFDFEMKGSVVTGAEFSFRICEVRSKSFANVVLSLSTLLRFDHLPFIVCVVTPLLVYFRLANTTFLKKISHSSTKLEVDRIRGSFLGTDIFSEYDEIENTRDNFSQLFSRHLCVDRETNLKRIVRETKKIVSKKFRISMSPASQKNILDSPKRFLKMLNSKDWARIEEQYVKEVSNKKSRILEIAKIENHRIRGREIEKILTSKNEKHDIGDQQLQLSDNTVLLVDIKSKMKHQSSSPKAYHIDKFLELLADEKKGFAFLSIAIDLQNEAIETKLVQPFDPIVINATKIRRHWSGRNTRGSTQLTPNVYRIFNEDYEQTVCQVEAVKLLTNFINL